MSKQYLAEGSKKLRLQFRIFNLFQAIFWKRKVGLGMRSLRLATATP
jgi:hypothetical protein